MRQLNCGASRIGSRSTWCSRVCPVAPRTESKRSTSRTRSPTKSSAQVKRRRRKIDVEDAAMTQAGALRIARTIASGPRATNKTQTNNSSPTTKTVRSSRAIWMRMTTAKIARMKTSRTSRRRKSLKRPPTRASSRPAQRKLKEAVQACHQSRLLAPHPCPAATKTSR